MVLRVGGIDIEKKEFLEGQANNLIKGSHDLGSSLSLFLKLT